MNYTIDERVSKLYHKGYKRTCKPDEIVLHGTAGGATSKAIIDWMLSLKEIYDKPALQQGKDWEIKRVAQYLRGIGQFHLIIDRDGTVTQLYSPDVWVYHSESSRHDALTIGIELVNPLKKNAGDYTEAQYKALAKVIEDLKAKYPSINKITTHSYNALTYSNVKKSTPCPGDSFSFQRLIEHMNMKVLTQDYGLKVIND